jgi:hypothetical protein
MSAKIMAEIHAHSQAQGSARLVLLEIAFYARDDGTHACPSMQTLADKLGRSQRHIQTMIRTLEENGHIRVFRDKSVRKRPRNFYHVLRPWRTAQTFREKDQKVPAQTIREYFSLDLKPNTSERKARVRTPEDEEGTQVIRNEIRHQETFLRVIGAPGSVASRAAQDRITSLKGLLGGSHEQKIHPSPQAEPASHPRSEPTTSAMEPDTGTLRMTADRGELEPATVAEAVSGGPQEPHRSRTAYGHYGDLSPVSEV